jgi:hypothetical protein
MKETFAVQYRKLLLLTFSVIIHNEQGIYPRDMPGTLQKMSESVNSCYSKACEGEISDTKMEALFLQTF